jgi:hypothetical protein
MAVRSAYGVDESSCPTKRLFSNAEAGTRAYHIDGARNRKGPSAHLGPNMDTRIVPCACHRGKGCNAVSAER